MLFLVRAGLSKPAIAPGSGGNPMYHGAAGRHGNDYPCRPQPLLQSDFELVAALEVKNFPRFVGGRHLKSKAFDDLAGELNLLGV